MLREVLFAKIHRATVTHCDTTYIGSITIDPRLLEAIGMVEKCRCEARRLGLAQKASRDHRHQR